MRTVLKIYLVFILILSFLSSSVFAAKPSDKKGIFLSEGIIGFTQRYSSGSPAVQEKVLMSSETGLGYIFGKWFYLGAIFNYTIVNETTDDSISKVSHQNIFQYYGPSLGWMGEDWFLLGHYFAAAEQRDTVTGDGPSTYTNVRTGTGYGGSLGYKFHLNTILDLAPVITYKAVNYTSCRDLNTGSMSACSPVITESDFLPYITLLIDFQ